MFNAFATKNSIFYKFLQYLIKLPKPLLIFSGFITSLSFAPLFFTICFFLGIPILIYYIKHSSNAKEAFIFGWLFGFGHFLCGLYWVAISITVYIEQFWWAIPFALCGLPLLLGLFIAIVSWLSFFLRQYNNLIFVFIFCVIWTTIEWVRSWLLTGFPWNLAGYIFCFSTPMLQLANITGIYGLSFLSVFFASSLFYRLDKDIRNWRVHLLSCVTLLIINLIFGSYRLLVNPTEYTDISIRLVQPSIDQRSIGDYRKSYHNIKIHTELSKIVDEDNDIVPDLIIWSEAAVNVPADQEEFQNIIKNALSKNSILITGGISYTFKSTHLLYNSIYAIDKTGQLLFNYNKTHLVPFGEYMPYKQHLGLKKLTAGFTDYTVGAANQVSNLRVRGQDLYIRPLICYESIFPDEVRVQNQDINTFINITNDGWFGDSHGPYQHFEISRLRAIENGLPLIRVGNNGLSGIIDPMGRVLFKTKLNEISVTDGYLPLKYSKHTLYAAYGNIFVIVLMFFTLVLVRSIDYVLNILRIKAYNGS